MLDERGSSLKLGFNGYTLLIGMMRDGFSTDEATLSNGKLFSGHVSDAIAYQERPYGASAISLCFEQ